MYVRQKSEGRSPSPQWCALHAAPLRGASSLPLDAHGDAHAAADAERGKALLGVALLHLVQQRHQHARPGGTDRMADRDRAAIDVDLGEIPAEVLVDRAGLRGERLVGLDQIEVPEIPPGV